MTPGQLVLLVENRSPVSITDIRLTPVLVDAAGHILLTRAQQRVAQTLQPGERVVIAPGVDQLSPGQLQRLRYRIDAARAAE